MTRSHDESKDSLKALMQAKHVTELGTAKRDAFIVLTSASRSAPPPVDYERLTADATASRNQIGVVRGAVSTELVKSVYKDCWVFHSVEYASKLGMSEQEASASLAAANHCAPPVESTSYTLTVKANSGMKRKPSGQRAGRGPAAVSWIWQCMMAVRRNDGVTLC